MADEIPRFVTSVTHGIDLPQVANGLIGYWPFDDNTANDYSGYGASKVTLGGTTKIGARGAFPGSQSISIPAASDKVTITKTSTFDLGTSGPGVSVAYWAMPTVNNGGNWDVFGKGDASFSVGWYHNWNLAGTRFHFSDGTHSIDQSPAFSTSLNVWVHIATSYDRNAGTFRVFKNGKLLQGYTSQSTLINLTNASNIVMGNNGVFGQFNGLVDDLRIYNRPLSDGEVNNIYQLAFARNLETELPALFLAGGGGQTFFGWSPSANYPIIGTGYF